MSNYKRGLRTTFQKSHDHVGGPWIATPGYIKNEINRLDTEMKSFDTDARAKLRILFSQWLSELTTDQVKVLQAQFAPPVLNKEDGTYTQPKLDYVILRFLPDNPLNPLYNFVAKIWGGLYEEWIAFLLNHDSWTENMWGSTVDTIESYRNQLKGMREKYNKLLGQFDLELDSPDPVKGPDWEGKSLFSGVGSLLKTIVIGGAIVIGGIFGIKLLQGGASSIPSGSSLPSLPAPASSPKRKSKGDVQRERVLAAMERKER